MVNQQSVKTETMSSSSLSLKAIIGLQDHQFIIPSYQRGYRWTEQQVEDLLNDILEFTEKKTDNEWYCLQPVVVKKQKDNKNENKNKNKYEVVDGQQRLTTICLILKHLNVSNLFKIEYETRNRNKLEKEKITSNDQNNSNIDSYHIKKAYKRIIKWFKDHENKKEAFKNTLLNQTKFIWYEVAETTDSIDIFTRLNSGKIPLTNAELIKALFLNKSNFPNADKDMLRRRQLEIASEWDRMEYALQDDAFWYFINKDPNDIPSRIEFIFDLMYHLSNDEDKYGNDGFATFRFFNKKFKGNSNNEKMVTEHWKEIKNHFQTLEEWYNDRELYHKIGYLIAVGTDIKNILNEKKGKSKTEFVFWINQQIKSNFKNLKLEDVEYKGKYVREILLLHNILTMLKNENDTVRFPFDRYKKEEWDIEHIHAIASEVKVKPKDLKEWLKDNYVEESEKETKDKQDKNNSENNAYKSDAQKHNNHEQITINIKGNECKELTKNIINYILKLNTDNLNQQQTPPSDASKEQQINCKEEFKELINNYIINNKNNDDNVNKIIEGIIHYVLGEEDHSLGNLCLLNSHINRSYKNAAFKKKRKTIIEEDKNGIFFPICTRNVFLKYYTPAPTQMELWNGEDRDNYLTDIKETLKEYLPEEEQNNNNQKS